MKILLLFILIFQISYVKADEIYNLIKIPNLEIYKLKNDNNTVSYTHLTLPTKA